MDASASPPTGRYDDRASAGAGCAVVVGVVGVVGGVAVAAGRIVRDVDVGAVARAATGSELGVAEPAAERLGAAGWFAVAGELAGVVGVVGVVARATGAAGCVVLLAGKRRTTGDSDRLAGVDALRADCAAAAADGAGSSERRAVAAATVNAGPVARRNPVGAAAGAGTGEAVSSADINGSTAAIGRATVSPGPDRAAVELAPASASTSATSAATADDDGSGGDGADGDGGAAGAGAAGGDAGAIDRRTTGLVAVDVLAAEAAVVEEAGAGVAAGGAVAAGAAVAEGDVVAAGGAVADGDVVAEGGADACAADALAAAAAARERGVAAWRSAAHRPAGGLTADAAEMAAAPAGAIGPDPNDGADFAACVDVAARLELAGVRAAGMRRTTFAAASAALGPDLVEGPDVVGGAASAARDPASPARLAGARSPGARSPEDRFAGPRGVDVRSRSTSIGPTDVTSGGRRTRTTSPPIRSAMCPGRGPSARPVRTTRGSPRGGTGVNCAAVNWAAADWAPVDWAAVDWPGVGVASAWPCVDHQYCHHRGGCTP